ncbi:hypothetical protein QOZ80_2BG0201080 [Eleusine coracana subsp. coracana]|nr:hypothetical protein QOZ80_2BG0200980 [Eleusine coracana subsp. coracana]KAK3155273.1 hypothetical protein QOZ80_2BG0201080 [Eleusine coracana subsp. coracana]
MVSPPSSLTPAAAAQPAGPQPSTITDGAVSGTLPSAEAFAVHYPGYPSSSARADRTLGGLPAIAKVRSSGPGARLELRFRPDDPYCHPAFGESRASMGLVLRLSKRKGDAAPRAEVVARVRTAYHSEGMADYQHVVPVHAAEERKKKRTDRQNSDENSSIHDDLETNGEYMMLVPPLFSLKDKPTKIALRRSCKAVSKSMQRGVVKHKWEMDIGPTHELPFNIEAVPEKINWEDYVPKDSADWDQQMAVCKLFDERPVWPKQSLCERLSDDGVHLSQYQFRRLLPRAGYYFSSGPFGKFWIRRGYDPRRDSESRIFQAIDFRMPPKPRSLQMRKDSQKWSDVCKLEAMPSKSSVILQFFELKDDFIQAEIMKPSYLSACSDSTGWFSKHMIETIRLQVRIRFLSLCPHENVENELRVAHELIEKYKKREAHCRSEQSRENKGVGEKAPVTGTETEDQNDAINSESEDVDDEGGEDVDDEEEEDEVDSDGYDSPQMAEDVGDFSLDYPHALGEGFSSDYFDQVLGKFQVQGDGQNRSDDAPNVAEASDDEFQIYEQSSDDEYSDG